MPFLPMTQDGVFQRGWLLDTIWHLVLPVACMTYGGFAFLSKLMRASVLENLTADFARTARTRGLREHRSLSARAGQQHPAADHGGGEHSAGMLGGSIIIESIFSINGMGRLMIEAIKMKDQELVLSEMWRW
ncbi:MAG: ABC transporter permease subunit [Thermomicrobiales bacterium]